MTEIEVTIQDAVVRLSLEELLTLKQALNEVSNALSIPDFQTRMGVTREEADELLHQLGQTIDRVMEAENATADAALSIRG